MDFLLNFPIFTKEIKAKLNELESESDISLKMGGKVGQSRPVGLPTPQHEVLWWRSRRRHECQNARMPSNPMDLSKSSGFASISSMDPRVYKSQMQTISQQ